MGDSHGLGAPPMSLDAFPWSDCSEAVLLAAVALPALRAVDGQPGEVHTGGASGRPVAMAAVAPAIPPADGQLGGLGAWTLNKPAETTPPQGVPDVYGHSGWGNVSLLLGSPVAAASSALPDAYGQLRKVHADPSDGGRGDTAAVVADAASSVERVAAPASVDPVLPDAVPMSSTHEGLLDEMTQLSGLDGTPVVDLDLHVDPLDFYGMDYRGAEPGISFPANAGELTFGQRYTPLIAPVSPLRSKQHGPAAATPPPAAAASPREDLAMEDQLLRGARPPGASCQQSREQWVAQEAASAAAARVDETVVSMVDASAVPGGGTAAVAPTPTHSSTVADGELLQPTGGDVGDGGAAAGRASPEAASRVPPLWPQASRPQAAEAPAASPSTAASPLMAASAAVAGTPAPAAGARGGGGARQMNRARWTSYARRANHARRGGLPSRSGDGGAAAAAAGRHGTAATAAEMETAGRVAAAAAAKVAAVQAEKSAVQQRLTHLEGELEAARAAAAVAAATVEAVKAAEMAVKVGRRCVTKLAKQLSRAKETAREADGRVRLLRYPAGASRVAAVEATAGAAKKAAWTAWNASPLGAALAALDATKDEERRLKRELQHASRHGGGRADPIVAGLEERLRVVRADVAAREARDGKRSKLSDCRTAACALAWDNTLLQLLESAIEKERQAAAARAVQPGGAAALGGLG